MKRVDLLRATSAALGGLAALTALIAFGMIALMRSGVVLDGLRVPLWTVPLIAGATVGTLSWVLLAGAPESDNAPTASRATIECSHCGNSMLEDWRLCPHCGSTTEAQPTSEHRASTT